MPADTNEDNSDETMLFCIICNQVQVGSSWSIKVQNEKSIHLYYTSVLSALWQRCMSCILYGSHLIPGRPISNSLYTQTLAKPLCHEAQLRLNTTSISGSLLVSTGTSVSHKIGTNWHSIGYYLGLLKCSNWYPLVWISVSRQASCSMFSATMLDVAAWFPPIKAMCVWLLKVWLSLVHHYLYDLLLLFLLYAGRLSLLH